MLMVAGMKELPPVPKRSASSGGFGMLAMLAIAGLLGFGLLKRVVFGAARTAVRASAQVAGASPGASQTPDWVARAEARVASNARSTSATAQAHRPRMAAETSYSTASPRASFGRRG